MIDLDMIAGLLCQAHANGRRIYVMGNGGSAAAANHFVCDLVKIGYPAFSLAANVPLITMLANDYGYKNIFAMQLEPVLEPGDIVIAISTSGNSPNVVKAVKFANSVDAITVGFLGWPGGKLKDWVEYPMTTSPIRNLTAEDWHTIWIHNICRNLQSEDRDGA